MDMKLTNKEAWETLTLKDFTEESIKTRRLPTLKEVSILREAWDGRTNPYMLDFQPRTASDGTVITVDRLRLSAIFEKEPKSCWWIMNDNKELGIAYDSYVVPVAPKDVHLLCGLRPVIELSERYAKGLSPVLNRGDLVAFGDATKAEIWWVYLGGTTFISEKIITGLTMAEAEQIIERTVKGETD